MEMQKHTCVTFPPHLSEEQVEEFKQLFIDEFAKDSAVFFISQVEAIIVCFAYGGGLEMGTGERLVVCHMEEEITV